MIHCDLDKIYTKPYVCLWLLLSFKAGFINSGGFLATGQYVSHVTGFGTKVGLAVGHDEILFGIELLLIPISFILGAFVTGLILDRKYASNEIPPYTTVQVFITILLGIVAWRGSEGDFGSLRMLDQYHQVLMISILCFICGLKNALTTWATHGKIRTTHLTGLSTDLGLNLPKVFKKDPQDTRFKESRTVSIVRLLTLLSFSLGAFSAAIIFPEMGFKGFYIAFVISIVLTAISFIHRQNQLVTINIKQRGF
ncbi:MAG: YoaK family protein [Bacteriovoracaceae bacterium]